MITLKIVTLIILGVITVVPLKRIHVFLVPLFSLALLSSVESFSLIYKYSFMFVALLFSLFLHTRMSLFKKIPVVNNLPAKKTSLLVAFLILIIWSLVLILQMEKSLFVDTHLINTLGASEVLNSKNIITLFVLVTLPLTSLYIRIGEGNED